MIDFSLLDAYWETSKDDLLRVVDSKGRDVAYTETCMGYEKDRRHARLISLLPRLLKELEGSDLCLGEHEYYGKQRDASQVVLSEVKDILGEVDYWANHPSKRKADSK